MAQQYLERKMLENQANVSSQKGSLETDGNMRRLGDAFSVFMKVKGSAKYWQHAKNELIAKVQQLGAFHVFFTLSCAEMRWPEVFVSIFRKMGLKVEHGLNGVKWTGEDDDIYVEGVPLWTYVDTKLPSSKHEFLKDHTVLITRIFENRVKSFLKNILMKAGKNKV